MDAPERRRGVLGRAVARIAVAAALIVSVTAGCTSSSKKNAPQTAPASLPPARSVPTPAQPAGEAQSPGSQPIDVDSAGRAKDPTLIVIDPATDSAAKPKTLAEAAAEEKERRASVADQTPKAVITNKNLASYAAGAVLTVANPETPVATGEEEKTADRRAVQEDYWRKRGLEIRQRWHDAVEKVTTLEAKVEALRTRFYSTDDPAVRDGQVKPEWDRAIADLEQARYEAARGPEEVERYLEEGRKAGALPGWLREGVDLEPEPVNPSVDDVPTTEPREPQTYSEDQSEPATQPPPPTAPSR